jgi:hypothetical protein
MLKLLKCLRKWQMSVRVVDFVWCFVWWWYIWWCSAVTCLVHIVACGFKWSVRPDYGGRCRVPLPSMGNAVGPPLFPNHLSYAWNYQELLKSGQVVSINCTKAYKGNWGTAPLILVYDTRWRRVINFTPRPLYPREKNSWYPLDMGWLGPRASLDGRGEERPSRQ